MSGLSKMLREKIEMLSCCWGNGLHDDVAMFNIFILSGNLFRG